jgi:hypothetical protein
MIAIKFSPIYEDRVSIYLKNSRVKERGITYDFKESPGLEDEKKCFWLFDYKHSKQVNLILSELKELKEIMGIQDLEFSYCHNEKEFYTQYSDYSYTSVSWFKI